MNWVDKALYETYHSKKNKQALPTVIIISAICLILHDALGMEIIIWTCYYLYCKKNNRDLEFDEENLRKRQHMIDIINGNSITGIDYKKLPKIY